MPEGVACRRLRDVGSVKGGLERPLDHRLMNVVASALARLVVGVEACGRKDPLPGPFTRGAGILPCQSVG